MTALNGQPLEERDHDDETGETRSIGTMHERTRDLSKQELAAVTLLETLDYDDRPSFAMQVQPSHTYDAPSDLIYSNPALSAVDGLLGKVTGQQNATSVFAESSVAQQAFWSWLRGRGHQDDPTRRGNTYMFEGYLWTGVIVGNYKIVSGVPTLLLWTDASPGGRRRGPLSSREGKAPKNRPIKGTSPTRPRTLESSESTFSDVLLPSPDTPAAKHGPFDYTLESLPAAVRFDPHIIYFRGVDWAKTPLGPMVSWSADLRCTVNMILNNSFPAVLFWGDEVSMIYNEPYVQLLGALHPCMGKSIRIEAPDHWPSFEPLVNHINATGRSLFEGDMLLFIDRHGFSEETHWAFQFVPILDNTGHIAAYYQSFFETTDQHLLERRVSSLVEMASQTANARDFQSYWDIALRTLTLNDKDVPFALLYAAERHVSCDMPSIPSPGAVPPLEKCLLKGSIGVEADHPIAPSTISINEESYIFHPFLLQAAKSGQATVVNLSDLASCETTLEGVKWRGYGDPCRTVVVCPILPTTGEQVEGFLILGTNPRRPFDEDYQQYVQVMLRLLATSLASLVLFDEEVRQREKAIVQAAQIQEQLLAELQLKEKKFQRFAERSDVGIFILDPEGQYTYRNQRWFDLFETATKDENAMTALQTIAFPEDVAYCQSTFAKIVTEHEPVIFELRTKMPWYPPSELTQPECQNVEHYKWILCSAYPELGPNGELREIVGNVTDISKQKWAEFIQKLRFDSALESKQHLEHFIDTTSHEMRNPLSAILQCADGILSSYAPDDGQPPTKAVWSSFVEQTLDAAQTIAQCAQHMRHIVDDILTISKLDSGLLVITPVDAQPESVVRHAVKMFEAEAKAAGVHLSCAIEQSYRDMNVDWVSLDPTRLLQILINLITNAIKFTRLEATRHVTVSLAATAVEPTSVPGGIQFNEDRLVSQDSHLEDDWKQDPELMFLQFSVSDTGRGLSEEERGNLFTRFSQASPRTHIHYGGSGLGLFISRRLTELQGGAIGLASESKKGSVFSFYIKTRRAKPALARRGSLPTVFPEDIRHRGESPLISVLPTPPPVRKPTGKSTRRPNSPSPQLQRQAAFTRRLPVAHSPVPPAAVEMPPESDIHELKRPQSVSETLHVLVVEDNLVNQRVLAKQLRNLGCVVSVANHGREALDFLPKTTCWNHEHPESYRSSRRPSCHIPSTEPIDGLDDDAIPIELSLILMDWEMPIMNGLTAVAKIRELERDGVLKGRVPVIGVTANVRQQQIDTAIAAGMDDVMGKPFRVVELLGRMRRVVAGMTGEGEDRHVKTGNEGE